MPTEALVSPLPRELTTPPVTKMCFVMASIFEEVYREVSRCLVLRKNPIYHEDEFGRRAKNRQAVSIVLEFILHRSPLFGSVGHALQDSASAAVFSGVSLGDGTRPLGL